MHDFHAITPIAFLFQKSRPAKSANHTSTPNARGSSSGKIESCIEEEIEGSNFIKA